MHEARDATWCLSVRSTTAGKNTVFVVYLKPLRKTNGGCVKADGATVVGLLRALFDPWL